ncbi:hypothetical protein COV20_00405 [Candidatus Woesearchaeota archaeon CG10_big_fil_rev_8_21_14_0_10_45_16]|nr:MAG: hypothetical protein COV20_00405 [Candidatus Woesearchaeota archaeon CG10_big_fil_rev_8_21_14_0_10_45_16]
MLKYALQTALLASSFLSPASEVVTEDAPSRYTAPAVRLEYGSLAVVRIPTFERVLEEAREDLRGDTVSCLEEKLGAMRFDAERTPVFFRRFTSDEDGMFVYRVTSDKVEKLQEGVNPVDGGYEQKRDAFIQYLRLTYRDDDLSIGAACLKQYHEAEAAEIEQRRYAGKFDFEGLKEKFRLKLSFSPKRDETERQETPERSRPSTNGKWYTIKGQPLPSKPEKTSSACFGPPCLAYAIQQIEEASKKQTRCWTEQDRNCDHQGYLELVYVPLKADGKEPVRKITIEGSDATVAVLPCIFPNDDFYRDQAQQTLEEAGKINTFEGAEAMTELLKRCDEIKTELCENKETKDLCRSN